MTEVKLTVGRERITGKIWTEQVGRLGERLFFQFPFHRPLINEIKSMKGNTWHQYVEGDGRKLWSVEICERNKFQLAYLMGKKPYARYDAPLDESIVTNRTRYNHAKQKVFDLFGHQPKMIAHLVQRRQCILAGEMGTTKTLSAIIGMEILNQEFLHKHGYERRWYYVAPKSALRAVEREFIIWGGPKNVDFMTYEKLVKLMKEWPSGTKPWPGLILDESSKVKNHQSQRAQAAQSLADGIRRDWEDDAVVWLMTGTPAPKSPLDWWAQAEIACPGFIKEGDIFKFKKRLAIIGEGKTADGGSYPTLLSWRDSEDKCDQCGKLKSDPVHLLQALYQDEHEFVPSKNEIAILYERLKGLVEIFFKKDCLDLPDKMYRTIELKPSQSTLRAASLIQKSSATVIEGLTRLRELSDGFQYNQEKIGKKTCPECQGAKEIERPVETPNTCPFCSQGEKQVYINPEQCLNHQPEYHNEFGPCFTCGGMGEVDDFKRTVSEVASPKDSALLDLLDEYEDVGRVVIYAGFTAAIDRCCRVCTKCGWHVIRIDQGKESILDDKGGPLPIKDYIGMFQDQLEKYPRVAFVAHPGSAGMGLTLTASPVIIYYSNDFNGENRTQSEDRIHRPGMDPNRGATIIDLVHLPSDQKVIDNLKAKRSLELMSMGDLEIILRGVGDGQSDRS